MTCCSYVTRDVEASRASWPTLLAGAAIGCATLVVTAPAAAQHRLSVDTDGDVLDLRCDTYDSCTEDADCEDESSKLGQELFCSSSFVGDEPRCAFTREGKTELVCCGEGGVGECPTRLGAEGSCTDIPEAGVSVCLYPDLFPVCQDLQDGGTLDLETMAQCLRLPGQNEGFTADWKRGDCDGDGVANGLDCFPCDPDRQECPVVDAGVDGSVPPRDDAGDETGSTASFRGDGGCECRAVSGDGWAGGLLPALLVLGMLAGTRRRKR